MAVWLKQPYIRCGLVLFLFALDRIIPSNLDWGFTPGKWLCCAWSRRLIRTASWPKLGRRVGCLNLFLSAHNFRLCWYLYPRPY